MSGFGRAGPQPLAGDAADLAANPREKSLGTAYLLWFVFSGLSAHRFYLGFQISAALQASLMPVSYALLVSGSWAFFYTMCAAGLWLLADLALMPRMHEQANQRIRNRAVGAVFA